MPRFEPIFLPESFARTRTVAHACAGVLACVIACVSAACSRAGTTASDGGAAASAVNNDGSTAIASSAGPNASASIAASASAIAASAPSLTATITAPVPPPLLPVVGEPKPTFRKANVDAAKLAQIFATQPELARIGSDPRLFDPNDGAYLVRSEAPHPGITFTTQPLLYSPEPGLEILVVTGHVKGASFVVALYVTGDDAYKTASYFVMQHDTSAVALAYDAAAKNKKLMWTSCWQCPGEEGFVSVREDRRVVIVQK